MEQEGKRISSLEELLETIDPSRTYDVFRRRFDEALRTFPFQSFRVNDWASCDLFVASLFARINTVLLQGASDNNLDLGLVTFRNVFRSMYGDRPERLLYERIIHGHDSGMNGFVRDAIDAAVEFCAAVPIANRVDEYIDSLSNDEYDTAARYYLAKWGHLLPSEITDRGLPRFAPLLRQFLKQHPRSVLQMRKIR